MWIHCLVRFEYQHISHLLLLQVAHLLVDHFKLVEVLEFGLLILTRFHLTVDEHEFVLHFVLNAIVDVLADFV